MAVTASGILSLPLNHLRTLLATCEAFQSWIGVADEDLGDPASVTAAAARIHLVALNEDHDDAKATRAARRPLAVIGFDTGLDGAEDAANSTYWRHSGPLLATFEQVVGEDEADSDADAILDLTNKIGAILEEVESINGKNALLKVTRWSLIDGPGRMPPEDIEKGQLDLAALRVRITWDEI